MSEEVQTEVEDGVLIVTINRPAAKNAMNKAAAEGIAAAMDRLDAEDDLRVAILTGAGGTFCSGMDLKGFLRGESPSVEGRGFGGVVQAPPKKPLIAAVEGYALAGGLELMIACDLVVANEGAKFGIPEAKRGLVAAAGGVMMLPDQIPERIAMELALTGEFIDAGRAYELGLINRVVSGSALDGAKELARKIAENGLFFSRNAGAVTVVFHDPGLQKGGQLLLRSFFTARTFVGVDVLFRRDVFVGFRIPVVPFDQGRALVPTLHCLKTPHVPHRWIDQDRVE